jgi:hypothetical protein
MRKPSLVSKIKLMGKNVSLDLYKVHSTYDKETDDWFVDRLESMDQIVILKSASQEEICDKLKVSRKKFSCLISKTDIFVIDKISNQPFYCMKKIEKTESET